MLKQGGLKLEVRRGATYKAATQIRTHHSHVPGADRTSIQGVVALNFRVAWFKRALSLWLRIFSAEQQGKAEKLVTCGLCCGW